MHIAARSEIRRTQHARTRPFALRATLRTRHELRDLFRDTIQTLWAHKLRTFLTMFGIAWGIISITLMVAATEGLRVGLKHNNESFGKDIMIFFAGRTSMQAGGMRAGRDVHWYEDDYRRSAGAVASVPLRAAGNRQSGSVAQPLQQREPADGGLAAAIRRSAQHRRGRRAFLRRRTTSRTPTEWRFSAATRRSSFSAGGRRSARRSGWRTFPTP